MTPERTLQSIGHCLRTENTRTAAKILEEYVLERIVEYEAQKLKIVKERLRQLDKETFSSLPLEEENKLYKRIP